MTTLFPSETQYRVLTLWQPWASLLVHGVKKIETRPSATSWTAEKGVYLIHTASKWTKEQKEICLTEPFRTELEKLGYLSEAYEDRGTTFFNVDLPLGQIIGSIEVTECCRIIYSKEYALQLKPHIFSRSSGELKSIYIQQPEQAFGDYTDGRYAWLTQNPRILKTPIPYKGGQGYYQKFNGDVNQL